MFVSLTTSTIQGDRLAKAEEFLRSFLPRMRRLPGVVAIYHYARPGKGDATTVVIWESEQALKDYRSGELVKEAIAFEKELQLASTREAYPLSHAL